MECGNIFNNINFIKSDKIPNNVSAPPRNNYLKTLKNKNTSPRA